MEINYNYTLLCSFYLKKLKEPVKTNESLRFLPWLLLDKHWTDGTDPSFLPIPFVSGKWRICWAWVISQVLRGAKRLHKGEYLRCTWAPALLAFSQMHVIWQKNSSHSYIRVYRIGQPTKKRMHYNFHFILLFSKKLSEHSQFFQL
jgi:hypothetical protein